MEGNWNLRINTFQYSVYVSVGAPNVPLEKQTLSNTINPLIPGEDGGGNLEFVKKAGCLGDNPCSLRPKLIGGNGKCSKNKLSRKMPIRFWDQANCNR